MSILRTVELTKSYRQGSDTIYAVKNVTFSVEEGEFAVIIGPSGSGKSTLLHLCAGLAAPTSGKIILDGTELAARTPDELADIRRQKTGIVFQHFNLMPNLTARENIIIPCLIDNKQPNVRELSELAEILGIADRLGHLPSELSGGQMQRVAIARALINHPAVLFADEPTGNLDKATSAEIMNLLETLHKRGQTILLVTHDMDIASRADTVHRISDGVLETVSHK